MRALLPSATFALATLLADPSQAQGTPLKPRQEQRWYGWQTLAVDGSVVLATVAMMNTLGPEGEDYLLPMLGAYVIGAPLVHAAHENYAAFPSVALRAVSPPLGFLVGLGLWELRVFADSSGSIDPGIIVCTLIGFTTPIVLDAAVFAYEPADTFDQRARLSPSLFVLPPRRGEAPVLGPALTGVF